MYIIKHWLFLSLWIFGISLIPNVSAIADEHQPLQIGYAQIDITPPLGTTMPGYFTERRSTDVLDPLLSKAVVLTQGDTTLAIVMLDLIGVKKDILDTVYPMIEKDTGLKRENIFIHATHTHTGVTVDEIKDQLPKQVSRAIKQAKENRKPENASAYGESEESSVSFIRRYLMKDGSVRTNPGRNNPEVIRPIGEIDPAVRILAFNDTKTLLVSHGLHPDCVGGTLFSADYPYHIAQGVQDSLGSDWNVLYLNACCGNINHIDVNNPDQLKGYEESTRIGKVLAQATLHAYKNAEPFPIDQLDAKFETVDTPIRQVPDELLQWAKAQMSENPDEASKRKFNEHTPSHLLALEKMRERDQTHPADIGVMRIGSLALVGLPAEVFVEIGNDIRNKSLMEHTWVIGITGGYMGYIPHRRGYSEGGYEATYAACRYGEDTPDLWANTAIQLIRDLTQE